MPLVFALLLALLVSTSLAQTATWQIDSNLDARWSHVMAWDPVRERVLLFGGGGGPGVAGDTWTWNGAVWSKVAVPGPAARFQSAMVHDVARRRLVLFGGQRGDTWEWDGADWSLRVPAASPSTRSAHAMAYDAARQRIVLFGGSNSSGCVGDTWEWDGVNWL